VEETDVVSRAARVSSLQADYAVRAYTLHRHVGVAAHLPGNGLGYAVRAAGRIILAKVADVLSAIDGEGHAAGVIQRTSLRESADGYDFVCQELSAFAVEKQAHFRCLIVAGRSPLAIPKGQPNES
jgi:hypothetical protein